MALTYKINIYETDPSAANKTQVTLVVTDTDNNQTLAITKSVVTGSKTSDNIVKAAYDASLTEINEWQAANSIIGKSFNVATGEIE